MIRSTMWTDWTCTKMNDDLSQLGNVVKGKNGVGAVPKDPSQDESKSTFKIRGVKLFGTYIHT